MSDFQPVRGGRMRRTVDRKTPVVQAALEPDQVVCPVDGQPSYRFADDKPGFLYVHPGRFWDCRSSEFRPTEDEVAVAHVTRLIPTERRPGL